MYRALRVIVDGLVAVVCVVAIAAVGLHSSKACAQPIPAAAHKYRAELTRAAHAQWGLDAPIAALAAQVHQALQNVVDVLKEATQCREPRGCTGHGPVHARHICLVVPNQQAGPC